MSGVRLAGLEHVLQFTSLDGKVYMRSYRWVGKCSPRARVAAAGVTCRCRRSLLKKSGCRTPRIELEEIGPSLDLVLRRTHLASDDLYKLAHRKPKALKVKVHLPGTPQDPGWFLQTVLSRAGSQTVLKRAPEDSPGPAARRARQSRLKH